MLFCLQLYLLSPFMRRHVRAASPAAHAGLTCASVAAACGLLAPLSPPLAGAFAGLALFVAVGCPLWLVRLHKFKAKISGPWDEAVPRVPTHMCSSGGGGGGMASGLSLQGDDASNGSAGGGARAVSCS